MKKVSILLLVLIMAFSLVACNGGKEADEPEGATYSFRLATHYNTSHPGYAALERIVEELKTKSDGDIEITIYPSSQLGDYTVTYSDLMKGAVDMALIPIPSEYDPKLEMNFIPFMVTDYDQMEAAFGPESEFYSLYTDVHKDLGVKLLGIYVEGLMGFGMTKLPDNYGDVEASKGLMIRCPNIEVYNIATEDMGYNAQSIPYADLYSALQTKIVDGWVGGTPQLNYTDFKDVIEYYVAYNVFAENIGFFMSLSVFEGLPAEYQTMIEDAFMKEAIYSYSVAEELDKKALDDLKAYDIEIITLTDEEMQAYIDNAKEVTWPKLEKNIGADTLKTLTESVGSASE